MNTSARMAKGMVWLVSGRLGNSFLSFVSTAVLARFLTPVDFGTISAAWVILALANVLFDGAFGVNLLRKRSPTADEVRTTLTMALIVAAVLMAVVVVAAPWVQSFFGFASLARVLIISSLVLPFKAVYAIGTAQLQRSSNFLGIALATLVGQFVGNILFAVPLALHGAGMWSLVIGLVLSGFLEAAYVAVAARLPFRPRLEPGAVRDVMDAGFFSLANFLNWLANTGANGAVGRLLGAADLGLYSRGWKLLDLFVAATATPLSRVLLPTFAGMRDNLNKLREAFLDVLRFILPAYAVASIILTLQAPLIVYLALGSKWSNTVPVAQMLFATLVPRCAVKASENFAVALGRSKSTAVRQGFYATCMMLGAVIGARYGITGVAIGVSVALILFYLVSMIYATEIGEITFRRLAVVHLRVIIFSLPVIIADLAIMRFTATRGLIISQLSGALAACVVALALSWMCAEFWFGERGAQTFRGMLLHRRPQLLVLSQ